MQKIMTSILNLMFREPKRNATATFVILSSLVLGFLTAVPELLMGGTAYKESFLSVISPYLWIPFGIYIALFLFIGAPFLYYAGSINPKMKEVKWFMVLLGLPAGALCIGLPIVKLFEIPSGPWNFGIIILSSILYLSIVNTILKKNFT